MLGSVKAEVWIMHQRLVEGSVNVGLLGSLKSLKSTVNSFVCPSCNAEDADSFPGWGRSSGEGHGKPLQYSYWRIPWTEEPGVTKSWT